MMHKHTKPAGQRKVSPPGPSYMSSDQIGELPSHCFPSEVCLFMNLELKDYLLC